MILEGLLTTLNEDGSANIAPMGPVVDESFSSLQLRPFRTSQTYANLKRHGEGVFHVTDDVLLLAQAAIHRLPEIPPTQPARRVRGAVLQSACRWYEFRVEEIDESGERARFGARVIHSGRLRDFFGFHRARHAVVEAAILATRVHLLPAEELRRQLAALRAPVEKTAGPRERAAFQLLCDYVEEMLLPPED